MLRKIGFLLSVIVLASACEKEDDKPKEVTSIDISSEFTYSNDLPGDLVFADGQFWVSATSSDKFRAFDAETGRTMTVWGKETPWSQGLDADADGLYQISFGYDSANVLTPHIAKHPYNGGQWEKHRSIQLPGNGQPSELLFREADNLFIAGLTNAAGARLQFFDPASGALQQVFRQGQFTGITFYQNHVWLAESLFSGNMQNFKIHKADRNGNIIATYDLVPGDGGMNRGGTVDGIAFKDNMLWYLNGALSRIVKSEIKGD